MLRELSIRNFALIDELALEFGAGFTVLTGETGAGKSIIIDALNAVLGQRIGADAIREGHKTARIEAVFDTGDAPKACRALQDASLLEDGEETVILSRQIASGRSTYRINHRTATLAVLQQVGRHLVDIHGQHEHQTLIHEENHLSFLDSFGGAKHRRLVDAYQEAFGVFEQARRALQDLRMGERERAQRLDMLRFQVQELTAADLQADEEETLASQRSRLQHAEKIREAIGAACDLLDGDSPHQVAVIAALQQALRELETAAAVDAELAAPTEELAGGAVVIEETVRGLRGYLDELEADPDRLEQIEQRLADLSGLKRKYGDSVDEMIQFRDRARAELAELENIETRDDELRRDLRQRADAAGAAACRLSQARVKLASALQKAVVRELIGLGMEAPALSVCLDREPSAEGIPGEDGQRYKATRRGIDICRFLFSANPGEPVRPLSKVASGGELSRLMLVFKSICSRGAEIATIVFDEVDVGIGGRVAHAVGERIVGLAAAGQVLCVTHLPQIARLADAQVSVTKLVQDGRTVIRAQPLQEGQRVEEIARMLGGTEADETARQHARELLEDGVADRERLRGAPAPR